MQSFVYFVIAAVAEIAGCYAFWAWLRLDKSAFWLGPGVTALMIFAAVLTRIEASNAGRAYASYGGIYILASLVWLWLAEGVKPTRWDLFGVTLCLLGTMVILLGSRLSGLRS